MECKAALSSDAQALMPSDVHIACCGNCAAIKAQADGLDKDEEGQKAGETAPHQFLGICAAGGAADLCGRCCVKAMDSAESVAQADAQTGVGAAVPGTVQSARNYDPPGAIDGMDDAPALEAGSQTSIAADPDGDRADRATIETTARILEDIAPHSVKAQDTSSGTDPIVRAGIHLGAKAEEARSSAREGADQTQASAQPGAIPGIAWTATAARYLADGGDAEATPPETPRPQARQAATGYWDRVHAATRDQ